MDVTKVWHLLHIVEKAQAHGANLQPIRDEALKQLHVIANDLGQPAATAPNPPLAPENHPPEQRLTPHDPAIKEQPQAEAPPPPVSPPPPQPAPASEPPTDPTIADVPRRRI